MQTSLLHSVLFVALAGGCAGSGQFTYASTATPPNLVVISPGVQVIADYDEPIFYSGNYYWRNQGGFWYRSSSYTRGWARVQVAPVAIMRIEQPSAYIRYRAGGSARVHAPAANARDHRDGRDHREVTPAARHDDKHGKRHDHDDDDKKDKKRDDSKHDNRD